MSDIRIAVKQLDEPSKSIGEALLEFYDTMKGLEKDEHSGGKQATKIVMTINDIQTVVAEELEQWKRKATAIERDYSILENNKLKFKIGDAVYFMNKETIQEAAMAYADKIPLTQGNAVHEYFICKNAFIAGVLSQSKDIEILKMNDEDLVDLSFNFGYGCDLPKQDKQQEALHDACVFGMKKVRDILLPHLHPKEQPKESDGKKIVIDVTMHEDGTCSHGYVTDFNILETIGILQVSSYRMTEKFSEEDIPKN